MIANIIFTETYVKDLTLNIGTLETELRIVFPPTVIRTLYLREGCLFLDTALQCCVKCSTELQ